ncbi:ATP-dependent exoDNAse (exonuclease V) alpha subunit [Acinetobacter lwoffii]|jgi:ATP-dependent exoDNAse (exonuclease V) alpha subunit|uniref:AAA family ATPase n=1 Tax=Acinetobacter lwoffii TaxID=28090 RepID=A0AAJ4P6W5_ACILW|nr:MULTISPECIES: AAA family ATPase [Acinetobacter]MCJ8513503.1 AAA family ATPase [Acinetobacter lwoffii]MCO8070110.1 AAA family ATPase [Acinetobacter lwoffii]MCO8081027.1 AAA family ATPase [Acinetobacter lwoffii]MDR6630781.1 ATP-dependent exoDNAse (exonuclease V) alpha subunit [Acinetobacter lwoffii]MEB6680467.1 AAA family ATPase [Acinetobacter lwoffii]
MKQETALKLLKAGENVFLTGSAGAGKTYTLNQYINYLKARKVAVAITASTGIAATHMNGMTIHTWAGIGIKDFLSEEDLKRMKERKYLKEHLENAQVLIIDEISMLHAKQLNLVNQVLKYFKESDEAFGGIQVIVAGDFFQLPPVGKNDERNRDKFCFMSDAWVEAKFRVCYLTEQHRQGNDYLNDILNAIRAQAISHEHRTALQATRHQEIGDTYTRLYTHNMDVDSINFKHLNEIDNDPRQFDAQCDGNEKLIETLKSSVRAPEALTLKKHAKVMFVKNNFDMGYINGSLGEVISFEEDDEYGVLPKVKLTDGTTLVVEPETWSVDNEAGKTIASFQQIPLRLAWAITIHKSQGMTLEAAEIDLSHTFEKGQGYVALSRLKSLNGLRLKGFNEQALELDSLAIKADRRFQELSDEAEANFENVDLTAQHKAFIRHCGGTLNEVEIQRNEKKISKNGGKQSYAAATLDETRELFEEGYEIADIATERGLTPATIINHLGRLHKEQGLDISLAHPGEEVVEQVRKIYKRLTKRQNSEHFNDDGSIKLRPIVELTTPKMAYDQVRLALLFVE